MTQELARIELGYAGDYVNISVCEEDGAPLVLLVFNDDETEFYTRAEPWRARLLADVLKRAADASYSALD